MSLAIRNGTINTTWIPGQERKVQRQLLILCPIFKDSKLEFKQNNLQLYLKLQAEIGKSQERLAGLLFLSSLPSHSKP